MFAFDEARWDIQVFIYLNYLIIRMVIPVTVL